MRIDTTPGLFRPAKTGLSVPSQSAANVKAQPARDPTLAPDPAGLSRAARTYTKTAGTNPASVLARTGAGPALSVTLSPEARAWMAERGLTEDAPTENEKVGSMLALSTRPVGAGLTRTYTKATEVPVPVNVTPSLDLGA